MGSELVDNEAEGLMVYWLRGHESKRNICFSKIQLVGQKNIETKLLSLVKARQNAIEQPLFCFSKQELFATSGL